MWCKWMYACLTIILEGNVICYLEEIELSLIDLLMPLFLCFPFLSLVQGNNKHCVACDCSSTPWYHAFCLILFFKYCMLLDDIITERRWLNNFPHLRHLSGRISRCLHRHSQTVPTPTWGPRRTERGRFLFSQSVSGAWWGVSCSAILLAFHLRAYKVFGTDGHSISEQAHYFSGQRGGTRQRCAVFKMHGCN